MSNPFLHVDRGTRQQRRAARGRVGTRNQSRRLRCWQTAGGSRTLGRRWRRSDYSSLVKRPLTRECSPADLNTSSSLGSSGIGCELAAGAARDGAEVEPCIDIAYQEAAEPSFDAYRPPVAVLILAHLVRLRRADSHGHRGDESYTDLTQANWNTNNTQSPASTRLRHRSRSAAARNYSHPSSRSQTG